LTSSANEYLISSSDKSTWILNINNCKKELRIRSGEFLALLVPSDWTWPLEKEKESFFLRNGIEESSRETLIHKILLWSQMQDANGVHLEIKELAAVLEKYKTLNGLQPSYRTQHF
jgi:hypothetical protein